MLMIAGCEILHDCVLVEKSRQPKLGCFAFLDRAAPAILASTVIILLPLDQIGRIAERRKMHLSSWYVLYQLLFSSFLQSILNGLKRTATYDYETPEIVNILANAGSPCVGGCSFEATRTRPFPPALPALVCS